ncbi:MAG: DnaJ domain-containing protein, partial [Alphaproteobacteria bacterium]
FSAEISKFLKIFDFKDEFNEKELKKRYKELVKKYHPDLNKNFLNKEKNIKEINKSYSRLIKFLQK